MSDLPYITFWTGDYIKDTRCLNLEEKGAWSDCILHMHSKKNRGVLTGTWDEISLLIGANGAAKCKQILTKISKKEVCDLKIITPDENPENELVSIINRRMVREATLSTIRKETGSKGGKATSKNKAKDIANKEAKIQQNTGNGIGNDVNKNKGVAENSNFDASLPEKKFKEFENQDSWFESVGKNCSPSRPVAQVKSMLKEFLIDQNNQQELYGRDRADLMRHFSHWIKKQKDMVPNTETPLRSKFTRRAAQKNDD